MLSATESITTAVLGLALDAASRRHQVIAGNIANADAAGYVPMRLRFVEEMELLQREWQPGERLNASALPAFQTRIEAVAQNPSISSQVRLDQEMAEMSTNAVQYQALVRALNRHLSILSSAAADGKR